MSIFDYFKQKKAPNCDWCESETRRSSQSTVEAITERMFKMQDEYIKKENEHFDIIFAKNREINNLRMENHALYKILESHNIKVDCKPIEVEENQQCRSLT